MPAGDDHAIPRPTEDRLHEIADRWGFDLRPDELEDYRELVAGALDEVAALDDVPEPGFDLRADAGPRGGYRPEESEDPHRAWITRCEVAGEGGGPLDDLNVGLKDCIALAGVEMTCGSRLLEGFVPAVDAPVVERLLGAGATVVGKTNMDVFLFGATGRFQDFGTTTNPHDPDHLAGGSTSGAAAIPAGDCDAVIGTDQNGSTRAPGSWSGCVGVKPTFGLVPYAGIFSSAANLDHVGVLTDTVERNARVLASIAGPAVRDGVALDPRQPRPAGLPDGDHDGGSLVDPDPGAYEPAAAAGEAGASGLTVGVLEEGFGRAASDPAVDRLVRDRIDDLEALGAETVEVSVPAHGDSLAVMNAANALAVRSGIAADAAGVAAGGWTWAGLSDAFARARRAQAGRFSTVVKTLLLVGDHLAAETGHHYYAAARNRTLAADRGYTEALRSADVLAMPTTPTTAHEADDGAGRVERIAADADVMVNTSPFNHTGHPAVTVPCGTAGGLPVGCQLVAARFDERTLYRAASAVEAAAGDVGA